MKHTPFAALTILTLLTAAAPAQAKSRRARLEEERAAKAAADRKAREEAERQEAERAAQAEAERAAQAEAKRRESQVKVRIESNYGDVRLEATNGAAPIRCTAPCTATLEVGASYRIHATGMQTTAAFTASRDTRLWKIDGASQKKKQAGLGLLIGSAVVGAACTGLGSQLDNDEASPQTNMNVAIATVATCGVALVTLITGAALFYGGGTKVETERAPAPATASKPRLHWNGTLTF